MIDEKPWYVSSTIISAAAIIIQQAIIIWFNVRADAVDAELITSILSSAATIVFGVVAIRGRVKASTTIKRKK